MDNKILLPELISLLAKATGKSKKDAETFIKSFFSVSADALANHETLKIKDFGTFKVSRVEPRKSVNVSTGSSHEIPAHFKVVFTPAKQLAEKINEEFSWLVPMEVSESVSNEELDKITGDFDSVIPLVNLDKEQEEQSEHLGEEIEHDFGEIEPVEPFGPVDPEDPEPGEPIPEDTALVPPYVPEDIPDEVPLEVSQEISATEVEKNKRRFGVVFFLILFFILIIVGAGVFAVLQYRNQNPEETLAEVTPNEERESGSDAPQPKVEAESRPADGASADTTVEEAAEKEEEVAPTQPSDGLRRDTISKTRYLITMAREYYGNSNFWVYIYIENSSKLGHPDRIKPGTEVIIPDLKKYGVNPNMQKDIDEAQMLGTQIYSSFK